MTVPRDVHKEIERENYIVDWIRIDKRIKLSNIMNGNADRADFALLFIFEKLLPVIPSFIFFRVNVNTNHIDIITVKHSEVTFEFLIEISAVIGIYRDGNDNIVLYRREMPACRLILIDFMLLVINIEHVYTVFVRIPKHTFAFFFIRSEIRPHM